MNTMSMFSPLDAFFVRDIKKYIFREMKICGCIFLHIYARHFKRFFWPFLISVNEERKFEKL